MSPTTGQKDDQKITEKYATQITKVVQMANLSVLSPGKWILNIFGDHVFRRFWGILESGISTFLSNKLSQVAPQNRLDGSSPGPSPSPRGLPSKWIGKYIGKNTKKHIKPLGTDDDDDATATTLWQTWDYLAPPPFYPRTEYLVRDPLLRLGWTIWNFSDFFGLFWFCVFLI